MGPCTTWCLNNNTFLVLYAQGKLGNREDAKDVVQDAVLRIVIFETEGGKVDNCRKFAFTVLDRRIIDFWRRKGRDPVANELPPELPFSPSDPSKEYQEFLAWVKPKIIPPDSKRKKIVFEMHFEKGESVTFIAHCMNLEEHQVRYTIGVLIGMMAPYAILYWKDKGPNNCED